ncbi:hypothetical protein M422DRAFT_244975 [Sphaerobolus stellatus SS14]|nr:hypothetical protein M422DRAFT_244975 [Sphaerobolus stellatus SS14]
MTPFLYLTAPMVLDNLNPMESDDPINEEDYEDEEEEEEEEEESHGMVMGTFDEELDMYIDKLRHMADNLEYQRSFRDLRYMKELKRQGNKAGRPTTWGEGASVMFYRTSPPQREAST